MLHDVRSTQLKLWSTSLGDGGDSADCDKGLLCCSEPEAAALLALATQFKPHVWMNVHSGMEALFMPYDHLAAIPKGATAQATLEASFLT